MKHNASCSDNIKFRTVLHLFRLLYKNVPIAKESLKTRGLSCFNFALQFATCNNSDVATLHHKFTQEPIRRSMCSKYFVILEMHFKSNYRTSKLNRVSHPNRVTFCVPSPHFTNCHHQSDCDSTYLFPRFIKIGQINTDGAIHPTRVAQSKKFQLHRCADSYRIFKVIGKDTNKNNP